MGVFAVLKKHTRVAREPRANRTHQQDRRTETAVVEMLPRLHGLLKCRLVQKRVITVCVAEV